MGEKAGRDDIGDRSKQRTWQRRQVPRCSDAQNIHGISTNNTEKSTHLGRVRWGRDVDGSASAESKSKESEACRFEHVCRLRFEICEAFVYLALDLGLLEFGRCSAKECQKEENVVVAS